MEGEDNWYSEVREYATENDINMEVEQVMTKTYQQYKNHVKEKIRAKVKLELKEAKKTKKKLRWIEPGKTQECTTMLYS